MKELCIRLSGAGRRVQAGTVDAIAKIPEKAPLAYVDGKKCSTLEIERGFMTISLSEGQARNLRKLLNALFGAK